MPSFRTALTVLLLIVLQVGASAEAPVSPSSRRAEPGPIASASAVRVQALSKVQLDRFLLAQERQASPQRQRRRGPWRIVAGAAVGATAGFFAGGYLGAVIDGDCGGCDDPGFKGFLIGAPTGAAVGGILGGKFLF